MKSRKQYNLIILWKLLKYVMRNPDQRFGQILRNSGLVVDFRRDTSPVFSELEWQNHFHEEPKKMLERMERMELTGQKEKNTKSLKYNILRIFLFTSLSIYLAVIFGVICASIYSLFYGFSDWILLGLIAMLGWPTSILVVLTVLFFYSELTKLIIDFLKRMRC